MAKWIHNISESEKTYEGVSIDADDFYEIPLNREKEFATNPLLVTDLANAVVKMSLNGTTDYSGDVSKQIDLLKGNVALDVVISSITTGQLPFAAKVLPDGKKLYIRVHGTSGSVAGAPDNVDFVIPYDNCKLTGIEIINGEKGDKVNFKVLDTPSGTISGVPNYLLNQFGFDVNIASDHFKYTAPYDADLIKDLKLRLEYDAINSDLLPKTIYVNFILHEVKV